LIIQPLDLSKKKKNASTYLLAPYKAERTSILSIILYEYFIYQGIFHNLTRNLDSKYILQLSAKLSRNKENQNGSF
jgi:hypothetical protein